MSTDFKGADQKLKQVLDKVKDVDPDLRFMALNDLNKLLRDHNLIISTVNSYSSKIMNILLDSLSDSNSDVQNQALKCFEPLVVNLDDREVLNLLKNLNANQTATASITTSIHTMAISETLENLNLRDASTGSLIFVELLPTLITQETGVINSLDSIEILINLIGNLSNAIPEHELSTIYTALVKTIFGDVNIISKKSIIALGNLVNTLSPEEFSNVLKLIQAEHKDTYENINITFLTYNSLAKANSSLFIPYLNDLVSFSVKHLYLDNEDLDDDQIKIDEVRFEALQLISNLISVGDDFIPFIDQILNIVSKFLLYDPYTNSYEEEEGIDEEFSDAEDFSDDEFDDVEEESDDNTWKLRKISAKLAALLTQQFPSILYNIYSNGIFEALINSVSDSSETVSFEKIHSLDSIIAVTIKQHGKRSSRKRRGSDVSMSDIDDSLTQLTKFRNKIVTKFIKELSNVKHNNLNKFNTLLQFFQRFNRLDEDLKPLLIAIREYNFGLNLDLLKIYSALLTNNDLEYFVSELNYIVDTINSGLTSKNHISTLNSIETATDLLNLTYNEKLTDSIIEIASSNKNDSEIRNTTIQSVGELKTLPSNKVQDVLNLFIDTLKYEPIVVSTIKSVTSIIEIYHELISSDIVNKIVQIYEKLVLDVNYTLYVIESLSTIVHYFQINSSIGDLLLQLFNEDKYQSLILRVISSLNFDKEKLKTIYIRALTIDDIEDSALIDLTKRIGSDLIPTLENDQLNTRNIKLLAEIIVDENLIDYIRIREEELSQGKSIIFNIKLLGFIGEKLPVSISIDQLLSYFKDDETKIYAAEALGRIISKDSKGYLSDFLTKIRNSQDSYLLMISVKQILQINNELIYEDFNDIWETTISVLQNTNEIDEDLSKISAQILGLILVNNNDTNYFYNKATELLKSKSLSVLYTIIAAIKFILAYDNIVSIELFDSLLLQVFNKISDEDLKIKQISIISLITVLNNQFGLLIPYLSNILPLVYEELSKKKQYQETIQIGPFKHKVDKGLEVRKNAFEILYKLSLNHNLLNNNVDFNEILHNVIEHGLSADIITISSLIIIKLLEFEDVYLSVEDKQFLSNGIDKLLGGIKKKEDQQKDSKEEQETKAVLINLRNSIFE
ncbi:Cullin-associated NEDD8-dissociated protein 1 [Wickerhamomyces ciferrii]|uniref:Cullin-associated NEDD8-dissociated protein 1 n=1 Tax=Wickerhamomyces ciferrii (strain ATCC 14091 / BCRC 22168 / CBS 111 / JCM 3599 / NBRC 0793 / NRRL Y-1031 F-60-10) TaxID=1206466 RepID=K0KG96_WICCF|nr:Cullin-associated NEDD8-dissociated protein 1 [Wickerhamomyces ciferrii]CCH44180.1 Cullin-associated NEDD8-dissociated protein 1 [Wickerhamomyces ciferrii]